MTNFDLVTLGHACTDLLSCIPSFPERNHKLEIDRIEAQGGGPAATAAVTAVGLGFSAAFIGQVGHGLFGELPVRSLAAAGVDVGGVEVCAGVSGGRLALVFVDTDTADRTIVFTRSGLPGLDPSRLDRCRILAGRLLLVDDLDVPAAIQAATWARTAARPVLLDAGSFRSGMTELLPLADYVICSSHFIPDFLGIADPELGCRALADLGPRVTGVTLGKEGALIWDGTRAIRQPAFRVDAIDTTGAGDVFHGAFACGVLEGWELARTTRFAAAAAALSCTRLGAFAGAPTRAAVDGLLARGEANVWDGEV